MYKRKIKGERKEGKRGGHRKMVKSETGRETEECNLERERGRAHTHYIYIYRRSKPSRIEI